MNKYSKTGILFKQTKSLNCLYQSKRKFQFVYFIYIKTFQSVVYYIFKNFLKIFENFLFHFFSLFIICFFKSQALFYIRKMLEKARFLVSFIYISKQQIILINKLLEIRYWSSSKNDINSILFVLFSSLKTLNWIYQQMNISTFLQNLKSEKKSEE